MEQISERYLIFQRLMTFFDEWLFYLLLLYLFERGHMGMLLVVTILGTVFVAHSYKRQWTMEEKRFGPLTDTQAPPV